MKEYAVKSVCIEIRNTASLPDGEYDGWQSGYTVQFALRGRMYTGAVERGVRGLNVPVKVKIENGQVTVLGKDQD